MAEQALLRHGMWLPVPDGVDDVTAAAILNPGMAAWKSIVWDGELTAGQTALVLGATGASGRIAAQLASVTAGAWSRPAATSESSTSSWRADGCRGQGRSPPRRAGRGDRQRGSLRPDRRLPVGRARGGGLRRADPP
jgi:hypothetical protein